MPSKRFIVADAKMPARRPHGRRAEANDEGSATVEFVALSLLLLIPLVYLVLGFAQIQAGALAAESAAASAARAAVVEGVAEYESGSSRAHAMSVATGRANAVAAMAVENFGFSDDDAAVALTCDAQCLEPGSNITARVRVDVPLPGMAGAFGGTFPLEVSVDAESRAPVDSVAVDR